MSIEVVHECMSNGSSFDFASKTKCFQAIEGLHNKLIPFCTPFFLAQDECHQLGNNKVTASIILLTDGFCSICNSEDDLYVYTLFPPSVVGLIDGYSTFNEIPTRPRHYIHAESDCYGYEIPLDTFVQKCDDLNLWRDICNILAQRMLVMSSRERELIGVDTYSKVRSILIELWLYPDHIRNQIRMTPFVQRRTGSSRSQIMYIISALRKGNYLEIEKGKLVMLNKLPMAF
ncbi:MAG TPA: helix-turn-helix domain-containing protein [Scandinavium sp.]|jgi:hypothetical protein